MAKTKKILKGIAYYGTHFLIGVAAGSVGVIGSCLFDGLCEKKGFYINE